jgi:hypothetical protein
MVTMTTATDEARAQLAEFTAAIDKAVATRADLAKRLEAAKQRLSANGERRRDLAFDAETGDNEARKAITTLAKEAVGLADDVLTLEAATKEAERRVCAAREAAAAEALRQKKRKAAPIAARAAARGGAIDEAYALIRTNLAAFHDELRELSVLGSFITDANLININLENARLAALGAPAVRAKGPTFAKLTTDYTRHAVRWAEESPDAPKDEKKDVA